MVNNNYFGFYVDVFYFCSFSLDLTSLLRFKARDLSLGFPTGEERLELEARSFDREQGNWLGFQCLAFVSLVRLLRISISREVIDDVQRGYKLYHLFQMVKSGLAC